MPRELCCEYAGDPTACMASVTAPLGCADDSPGWVDGTLSTARFDGPAGLVLDEAAGIIYLADSGNHVVRGIDITTVPVQVTTVAGVPQARGYYGDGVDGHTAYFNEPQALALGPNGARDDG